MKIGYINNNQATDASLNYDKQLSNVAQNVKINQTNGNVNEALRIIKSLSPGDVFAGDIMDSSSNGVTISLPDGKSFTAALLNNSSYNIGDRVQFVVQDNNGGNVLLKALSVSESAKGNTFIQNALDMAGLPATDRNLELVESMMRNSMSLNKETLLEMAKLSNQYSNYPVNDVVSLSKLDINVTAENLKAFENYSNYNNEINTSLNDLSAGISESMDSFKALSDISNLFGSSVNDGNNLTDSSLSANTDANSANALSETLSSDKSGKLADLKNGILNAFDGINNDSLSKELNGFISQNEGKSSTELLSNLSKFLDNIKSNLGMDDLAEKAVMKKLFSNSSVKQLVSDTIDEYFKMNPKDIEKDGAVKEHIAKTLNKLNDISDFANKNNIPQVNDTAANIRNNLEFLNNLNQFVAVSQVPLRNIGDGGEGELYVYKRKKGEDDGTLKAFLHLDMEHLGPVDVYVTLKDTNVATNFCVGDVSVLDFLEEHMDELTARLNDLGYNVTTHVTDNEDTSWEFGKEIIAPELPVAQIKRFSFDMKA